MQLALPSPSKLARSIHRVGAVSMVLDCKQAVFIKSAWLTNLQYMDFSEDYKDVATPAPPAVPLSPSSTQQQPAVLLDSAEPSAKPDHKEHKENHKDTQFDFDFRELSLTLLDEDGDPLAKGEMGELSICRTQFIQGGSTVLLTLGSLSADSFLPHETALLRTGDSLALSKPAGETSHPALHLQYQCASLEQQLLPASAMDDAGGGVTVPAHQTLSVQMSRVAFVFALAPVESLMRAYRPLVSKPIPLSPVTRSSTSAFEERCDENSLVVTPPLSPTADTVPEDVSVEVLLRGCSVTLVADDGTEVVEVAMNTSSAAFIQSRIFDRLNLNIGGLTVLDKISGSPLYQRVLGVNQVSPCQLLTVASSLDGQLGCADSICETSSLTLMYPLKSPQGADSCADFLVLSSRALPQQATDPTAAAATETPTSKWDEPKYNDLEFTHDLSVQVSSVWAVLQWDVLAAASKWSARAQSLGVAPSAEAAGELSNQIQTFGHEAMQKHIFRCEIDVEPPSLVVPCGAGSPDGLVVELGHIRLQNSLQTLAVKETCASPHSPGFGHRRDSQAPISPRTSRASLPSVAPSNGSQSERVVVQFDSTVSNTRAAVIRLPSDIVQASSQVKCLLCGCNLYGAVQCTAL